MLAVAGVAVAAAAAVVLVGVSKPRTPLGASFGEHPLSVGEWVSATEAGTPPIHFSDGSQVSLAPGSRARLATLDSVGAHLVLESGAADENAACARASRRLMVASDTPHDAATSVSSIPAMKRSANAMR